jgi:hypothetical protein
MKCWNSAFKAQGSRVIIVVVQVAAMETLRKKERGGVKTGWNSFYHQKKGAFLSFTPTPLMLMHLFAGFTLKIVEQVFMGLLCEWKWLLNQTSHASPLIKGGNFRKLKPGEIILTVQKVCEVQQDVRPKTMNKTL